MNEAVDQIASRAMLKLGASGAMARRSAVLLLLMVGFGSMPLAAAQNAARSSAPLSYQVPPALEPWVDWVLAKHPERVCPWQVAGAKRANCLWVNGLEINLGDKGLDFRLSVQAYAPGNLTLPGNAKFWPTQVQVNAAAAVVTRAGGKPAVRLAAGRFEVTGKMQWSERPDNLDLPTQFGVLRVQRDGEPVLRPTVNGGRLLLTEGRATLSVAQPVSLSAEVFRQIVDGAPLQLHTYLRLRVSGPSRIETLGQVLLPNFKVTHINSPLPARLQSDGNLQIQVEPGEHLIQVMARAEQQLDLLESNPKTDNWPQQEVWAFAPRRDLRLVNVSGGNGVDLSQVNAPFAVDGLQGFTLARDQGLQLQEQQRGDPNPAPGQLAMRRSLWLNFDGSGYVVRDDLSTQLRRAGRLAASYSLGSVEVDGTPQLVTRLGDGEPGVELAPGQHQITAVSEIAPGALTTAVGWNLDADSLSATLHLPPGWRLLWATGVDSAPSSWLERWTLWDLFLVILSLVLAWRFLGVGFSLLLGFTLLIAYQQSVGFAFVWLLLLLVVVVLPYLKATRLHGVVRISALLLGGVTLLAALGVAIDHVRQGIYPQLGGGQGQWVNQTVPIDTFGVGQAEVESMESPEQVTMADDGMLRKQSRKAGSALSSIPRQPSAIEEIVVTSSSRKRIPDGMQVQTGPGQPAWNWVQAPLNWHGPVAAEQPLQLTLMPPLLVRIWHFLIALTVMLVSLLLLVPLLPSLPSLPGWLRSLAPSASRVASVVVLMTAIGTLAPAPNAQAASATSTPDAALLQELEQRLLAPPACMPGCASLGPVQIGVTADALDIKLQVHVAALVAVPIPGSANGWQPSRVTVGGSAGVVSRNAAGELTIALPAGVHQVRLQGSLAQLEQVDLTFALAPAIVLVEQHAAWQVQGLRNQRLVRRSISLVRKPTAKSGATDVASKAREQRLQPDVAPAYVRVERDLEFGLDWRVVTKVTRLAPQRGSFSVKIPLLSGEAVLDDKINTSTADGVESAHLVFGVRQSVVRWESRLAQNAQDAPVTLVQLAAPSIAQHQEVWSFRGSNLWHLHFAPSAGLVASTISGRDGPVFYPRSDETLQVKPEATVPVPGASTTVHSVNLTMRPGDRLATSDLQLRIQSSQGGDYGLELPLGAELSDVWIDGERQPLSLRDNRLDLPLATGMADYRVTWRAPQEQSLRYTTDALKMASPLTNVSLNLDFPKDRWVLALGGPSLGPALLFWGVFFVVAGVGWILSRVPGTALRPLDALLLAFGLTLCNLPTAVLVAVWVLVLRAKTQWIEKIELHTFRNAVQVLTAGLTIITVIGLVVSVPMALLGSPDMQVVGNGSGSYFYRWYADQADGSLPTAWVISLPLWVYRVAMLLWSLWLAFALLRWLRWGWQAWSTPKTWYPNAAEQDKLVTDDAETSKSQAAQDTSGDDPQGPAAT